jgi:hypothetical protein
MNDRRVNAIRNALEAFVESIDAVSRLARWGEGDPVPDSLRLAASQLEANRKTADDLAQGTVSGTPAIVHRLTVTSSAIKNLSAGYREFLACKSEPSGDLSAALSNLDDAIDSARETLRTLD